MKYHLSKTITNIHSSKPLAQFLLELILKFWFWAPGVFSAAKWYHRLKSTQTGVRVTTLFTYLNFVKYKALAEYCVPCLKKYYFLYF